MVNLSLIKLDVDEDDMMDEVSDLADLVENILIVVGWLTIVDRLSGMVVVVDVEEMIR